MVTPILASSNRGPMTDQTRTLSLITITPGAGSDSPSASPLDENRKNQNECRLASWHERRATCGPATLPRQSHLISCDPLRQLRSIASMGR